jgi:hypothetical protein
MQNMWSTQVLLNHGSRTHKFSVFFLPPCNRRERHLQPRKDKLTGGGRRHGEEGQSEQGSGEAAEEHKRRRA